MYPERKRLAYTVPTVEPTEITAGDSLQWDRTYSDYPPSAGWSLSYVLTGAHAEPITIAATANDADTGYEVRVATGTTVAYSVGRYTLVGHVSDGTARHRVYVGPLVVLPDPATATPELSFNERMLAAVEDKIATRIAADISGYTLEQQEVQREELRTLTRQRNAYADAVRRERGGRPFQTVGVSFGAPS